jgi:23S rRNA pseudouridine1911/1915/1917 synthase
MAGERLDKALTALLPDLTRSRVQALLEQGHVTRETPKGSAPATDGAARVRAGELYTLVIPVAEPSSIRAQAIPLSIVFEDAHLLVIDKPAGMTVHPAPGSPDSTLVNALLAHCGASLSGIGGVARPGIVHRIDKDTSGLLVVAKHDAAHQHLSAQLLERTLKRTYQAVVWGTPAKPAGTLTGNIGRHPVHRQKMAVVKTGGKAAATHYTVMERFAKATLVECRLETGRTHQIRVHFAQAGHSLVGDPVYGRARAALPVAFARQALHAWRLALVHPASGEAMQFEAPLPEDFRELIEALRHD